MNFQVYPNQHPVPSNLVGSLIAHKPGGAVRKVIRDDGDNGLWISHPGNPSSMYFIPREEYRNDWVFHKFEGQITREDLEGHSFDDAHSLKGGEYNLNLREKTTVAEQEATPMPREETDRQAMADEILNKRPADETLTGHPVGANEEPADTFEEDRAATEDAADEAEAMAEDSDDDDEVDDEDDGA